MFDFTTNSVESLMAAARQAHDIGQYPAAEALYRKVLALNPTHLDALNDLAAQLKSLGRLNEAFAIYQHVLRIHPNNPAALNNSGSILLRTGHTDQAIAAYRRFLSVHPPSAAVYCNLGGAYQDCGMIEEAHTALRRAIELDPAFIPAASALLIILQYRPEFDAHAIYLESKRVTDNLIKNIKRFSSHANNRSPDRRLRIGYVSPDFNEHPVGRFMHPLLAHHNHADFEIFCYSLSLANDQLTEKLCKHADTWRDAATLSDADLFTLIRKDQIDILVDLAMHGNGGRPLLFARKPAPVQTTYLAYPGTSGFSAIDYRLTDPHLDPEDSPVAPSDSFPLTSSEKPLRLPQTYWCYEALPIAPPPSDLPALQNGYITFGCLNNSAKLSDRALDLWARLLASIEGSRLLLYCPVGTLRERILKIFSDRNVPKTNLAFVTRGPFLQYFQHHHRIDIALDPFPYCGGTTTCDALWMGVPVVTLRGNKPVARASILSNAKSDGGYPELIANTAEDYIRIATQLAGDLPRLADLRRTLRPQMQSSPLMNAPIFTRHLESAYRQMWQTWCNS